MNHTMKTNIPKKMNNTSDWVINMLLCVRVMRCPLLEGG